MHEAQPLDVSFIGPLKEKGNVCHDFIQSLPGKAITTFNFSSLLLRLGLNHVGQQLFFSGFEKTGIIPFNPYLPFKVMSRK